MRQRKAIVDKANIERATQEREWRIKKHLELAEKLKNDPERDERLAASLCPWCHYTKGSRLGGAAMTQRPCGICEKEMVFSSTATDMICSECAKEKGLCKRCGGEVSRP